MNSPPLWQDPTLGAAKRVAHYLATVIGEGQKFEKALLRTIVPNTEQVDRRMRDLRRVGWKIRNYKDSGNLKPNELFLEHVGDAVWKDGYKWPEDGLTAGKRRKVFDRDGRRCMVCGIDFGDEYFDRPGVIARPTIGHITPKERGGTNDVENLRPECHLCNETARNLTEQAVDVELLKRRILELRREDKRQLAKWMQAEKRTYTDAERLWAQYNQLPKPARDALRIAVIGAI
jgi:5-methylcytosine-specific restriction endonuclease McrA